jgi:hypothetical protein
VNSTCTAAVGSGTFSPLRSVIGFPSCVRGDPR